MDVKERMAVVGSDGRHVGTVEKIEGTRMQLTRSESDDQEKHYLGKHLVEKVEAGKVTLSIPAAEADAWQKL
jgi:hypothetical protein